MRIPSPLTIACALLICPIAQAQNDCALADLNPIALDKNKNGAISRDEANGSVLAWSFDEVDSNGDGIINQAEFGQRCAPAQKVSASKTQAPAKQAPNALEQVAVEKSQRQVQRQTSKAESRVDRETDKAVDKAVDRGLDRLFGR